MSENARPLNEGSHEWLTPMRESDSARQGKWLCQAEADRHELLKHIDRQFLEIERSRGELAEAQAEIERLTSTGDVKQWIRDEMELRAEIADLKRELGGAFYDMQVEKDRRNADQLESLQSRCRALEAQLTEHRVFTHYIAKRYEEGWDEPVTERFYLRAMAALAVPPTDEPKEQA